MSGHKSFVTMGPESSWGSAPSAMTHKLEILPPWDVAAEIGEIEDGSLYNSPSPRGFYAGGELARGPLGVRANYEGVLELLRGVLPTYSATDVEAGVVRDHLFKEGPTLKSYHFDASEGDIPVGKVARIAGTKLTRFTLAGTAGQGNEGMLRCEFGAVGKVLTKDNAAIAIATFAITLCATISGSKVVTKAGINFYNLGVRAGQPVTSSNLPAGTKVASVDSATQITVTQNATSSGSFTCTFSYDFPAVLPVLFHQAITVDDGAATDAGIRLRSFELTIEQPHDEDDSFYMGSKNPDESQRASVMAVTLNLTQVFKDLNQFNKFKAGTAGSPQLIFRHPDTIGTSSFREFEIRMNNAVARPHRSPVAGYGKLIATTTYKAAYDAVDASSVAIRVRGVEAALA